MPQVLQCILRYDVFLLCLVLIDVAVIDTEGAQELLGGQQLIEIEFGSQLDTDAVDGRVVDTLPDSIASFGSIHDPIDHIFAVVVPDNSRAIESFVLIVDTQFNGLHLLWLQMRICTVSLDLIVHLRKRGHSQ